MAMTISQKISKLRDRKGLSQLELAEKLGVSQSTVAMWESGKRNISNRDLINISKFFNVSIDYLFGINQTPSWTTQEDTVDFRDFLEENMAGGMTFDGENLTDEENEKVKIAMTQIFWKKLQKIKEQEGKKSCDNK